ncbi:MAG TPA: PD-(D/E)XK nuclease family transposase [Gammaproteobacteria bacterium]|nr:PD-(D/E)XK nuclease family transposase [Gammaproteobacteria bacterium]
MGLLGANFDLQTPDFYHHYKIVNVEKPTRELKGLQFVFIELKKFKPNNMAQKKLQVLWLRFMSEINENTTTIDPELLNVPEIHEAIELSEQSAYNAAELEAYDTYWDAVSTEKTLLSDRYEKGKEKGNVESKADIAKKMLIKGMEFP